MTASKPRENHYIPQGYMRGFAETKNQLHVLDKTKNSIRPTSPKGVGYLRDFYTSDTIDEKDSAEVEKTLGKIETTCLPILRKISSANDLTNPERADLAIYIALQYGRTPFARSRADNMATIIATNEVKRRLANAANDPKGYQELVGIIRKHDPDLEIPSREKIIEWASRPGMVVNMTIDNGSFAKQFFEQAREIAAGLLEFHWEIYHAPKGAGFITSDNPIGLHVDRKLKEYEVLAILLPGVKRYIPLSSKTCLVIIGEWEGREIKHSTVSKAKVREINKIIFEQAQKYVISGSDKLLSSFT
jgi:hypothetical protein